MNKQIGHLQFNNNELEIGGKVETSLIWLWKGSNYS
jgi:hypothetical protein